MTRFAFFLSIVVLGIPVFSVRAEQATDRRPAKIWNRTGPLGDTPKHVTDAYPLSVDSRMGTDNILVVWGKEGIPCFEATDDDCSKDRRAYVRRTGHRRPAVTQPSLT